MAVDFVQTPTSPNLSNTKLFYVLSGSGTTSNPQYSYVVDIYKGGTLPANFVTRITQVPNPEGVGVFDVSRIINANTDTFFPRKTGATFEAVSPTDFYIYAGEQYGTSISSSVTYYSSSALYDILQSFQGTIDPNSGNYNFARSGSQHMFTNQTTASIADGYYCRLPIWSNPSSPQIGIGYDQFVYDENFNVLDSVGIGGGSYPRVYNIGIEWGFAGYLEPDWEYVKVQKDYDDFNSWWAKRVYDCGDGITHFMYRNPYGMFDYYSLNTPLRRTSDIQRDSFNQPKVDYSSAVSTYDITKPGEKQYHTDFTDTYEITTPYIDQETATWLTDLLESEEVYIQQEPITDRTVGADVIPVVITNSSYTWNTNENRQKLFQYTITFRPSKGRNIYEIENEVPPPAPVPPPSPSPTPSVTPTPTPTPSSPSCNLFYISSGAGSSDSATACTITPATARYYSGSPSGPTIGDRVFKFVGGSNCDASPMTGYTNKWFKESITNTAIQVDGSGYIIDQASC